MEEEKQQKSPDKTVKKQAKHLFKKGQSGNPNGRPKGTFSLITLLKNELQQCPEGQDKKTYADLIIKRMLKEAIEKGDQSQIRLIWNYIEGMPKQAIEHGGEINFYKWNKYEGGKKLNDKDK